jgi:hypothetical protein
VGACCTGGGGGTEARVGVFIGAGIATWVGMGCPTFGAGIGTGAGAGCGTAGVDGVPQAGTAKNGADKADAAAATAAIFLSGKARWFLVTLTFLSR